MTPPSELAASGAAAPEREYSRRVLWVGVFLVAWIVSAAICFALAYTPGYAGDVTHYKYWTRVIAVDGLHAIYSGTYPETYAIYPPVTLYALDLVAKIYERLQPEATWVLDAMLASNTLTALIKSVAIVFHLALGIAIFLLLWALAGVRAASLASVAYLLNPSMIFDSAYWGQPDAAHSLWSVCALGLVLLGWWQGSWVAAGLAAMTKPQAWSLVPLFLIAQARSQGWRRVIIGAGIAGIVVVIILMPFIRYGRLGDFLTLPGQIAGVMPVASANAHNLWWIVSRNPAPVVFDSERVLGPLTYRQLAVPLVLAVAGFTLWRMVRAPQTSIFLLAAYQAFGWFCFTTQAHENHPFMVIPLLIMAAPVAPLARWLALLISVTLFANMTLHDPALIDHFADVLGDASRYRLQILNAWLNLLIFGVWTAALVLKPRWIAESSRG